MKQQAITVTELNTYARAALEQFDLLQNLMICGEITGFTRHYRSGHCYFTLRDEQSSIKAVMFARQAALLGFQPQDGMEVVIYGRASIYERDGAFQLYAEYMRPFGVGSAQKAFDQLKAKLEKEGLFDQKYKKTIPAIPKTIGLVTSKTGAALQDIRNVIGRRWPGVQLILAPVSVQGQFAEQDIARGIRAIEADGRADVLLISRGGGSREDLWVFNSELIARTAFQCKIPIISAVGHEIDYTILDYVADLRAPTPSAAAELCVPDREEWLQKIQLFAKNMQNLMQNKLEVCYNKLEGLSYENAREQYRSAVEEKGQQLAQLSQQIEGAIRQLAAEKERQLSVCAALAATLNPYGILARGYAVVEKEGKIQSVSDLKQGQQFELIGTGTRAICTADQVMKGEVLL